MPLSLTPDIDPITGSRTYFIDRGKQGKWKPKNRLRKNDYVWSSRKGLAFVDNSFGVISDFDPDLDKIYIEANRFSYAHLPGSDTGTVIHYNNNVFAVLIGIDQERAVLGLDIQSNVTSI